MNSQSALFRHSQASFWFVVPRFSLCVVASSALIACGGGVEQTPESALSAQTVLDDGMVQEQRVSGPTSGGAPSNLCSSSDVGNWTAPKPTAFSPTVVMTSLQQPGSRLYYISAATGSDATGQMYFWNGSKIVDASGSSTNASGMVYGTDPMNPSAAVKSYRRWAYVAPRQDPSRDIGSRANFGTPEPGTRGGFPDWWLFKRGETFDLSTDMLSFWNEVDPNMTAVNASLAVSGGRSATERQIVGAYGNPCDVRPRFMHPQAIGFISRFNSQSAPAVFKNVAYLSLHFDGHDRPLGENSTAVTLLYQNKQSTDILFEDMWLDATTVNIGGGYGGQVTFRRSLITDNFGGRSQGIYYDGSRDGRLRIEDSILMRNGFLKDPKLVWPPSGDQVWDIFSRNMYFNGQTNNMSSALVDSVSMLGASGDQFRQGMKVERNFFYQGYVTMGAYGGYPDTEGPTGTLLDNVLQRFQGTGTNNNQGQPGWGIGLTSGAFGVEVARNIVTSAQHAGQGNAFGLSPLSWQCYAHTFHYATRGNNIHHNIFESPDSAPIAVEDGVAGESPAGCANWQFPGVKLNTVSNNVLISPINQASQYVGLGAAAGTNNDTVYSNNLLFSSRASAATAQSWSNPSRTLKTHLKVNGITVTSSDGFDEYYALATQMRKGKWDAKWGSKAMLNHVRSGFNMTRLP
jgi:hypothetical protein